MSVIVAFSKTARSVGFRRRCCNGSSSLSEVYVYEYPEAGLRLRLLAGLAGGCAQRLAGRARMLTGTWRGLGLSGGLVLGWCRGDLDRLTTPGGRLGRMLAWLRLLAAPPPQPLPLPPPPPLLRRPTMGPGVPRRIGRLRAGDVGFGTLGSRRRASTLRGPGRESANFFEMLKK